MEILFINYPKCSTCIKARKWLEEHNISFINRDIVKNNPNKEELKKFISLSGLPIKKFFNTSGLMYKELNLKDRLKSATDDEMLDLLASNGMLVKRPLVITGKDVLIGFKEEQWKILIK